MKKYLKNKLRVWSFIGSLIVTILYFNISNTMGQVISAPTVIRTTAPLTLNYNVTGNPLKKINLNLSISSNYANLSLYANNVLVLDNIDVPNAGNYQLNAIGLFNTSGTNELKLVARGVDITINSLDITEAGQLDFPSYRDITNEAGLVSEASIKYGGPSIADMDNDGDYDLICNNHNEEPTKLYWNDGDGTVTQHNQDLARWYRHDLHGSAAGDYDNDGDLDLVIALGGGNGTSPQPPVFYRNDNGTFVENASGAGLTSGARGRSARWSDMDLDGDLDLFLANAAGVNGANGARHIFYRNNGNGTFSWINVAGIENANGDRVLLTDLNNDNIDDIVLFFPLNIWKGNGDFTFTDVTNQWLPASARNLNPVTAVADIDIDNDGDQDLYIARGTPVYQVANKSLDFNPENQVMDVKDEGNSGTTQIDLEAGNSILLTGFEHVYRSTYNGNFPVYMGSSKTQHLMADKDERYTITSSMANGWPATRNDNGFYIGYLGNGQWKVESVRNGDIYWGISWTIEGVSNVSTTWSPNNKNHQDVLLRNDNGVFTDVSTTWNIPIGGNNWGVTTGDFNNDSYQDIYVYRYPYLKQRVADYMLLNTGNKFEISTSHAASITGGRSHGDMGQAFDFDLDGDVDILNGDDEFGKWYLYRNNKADNYNYSLVRVGYSPQSNVDPIGAKVTLHTSGNVFQRRVGSAGECFSQSLLNTVHFGLGTVNQIDRITVRWRNGETMSFSAPSANRLYDTDNPVQVEPTSVAVNPSNAIVGLNKSIKLIAIVEPVDATNKNVVWSSDNPSAVSVDANGIITGHTIGASANITATTVVGSIVGSSVVTVVETPVELVLEAEDFEDTGGTYDDSGANGPGYGVNKATSIINYVNSGDWATYNKTCTSSGIYQIQYLITSPSDNAQVQFEVDGNIVSTDNVNNNGSWGNYETLYASVLIANLSAGDHAFKVIASGTNAWQWNLDKIILTKVGGSVPDPESIDVTPSALNLKVGETGTLAATVLPVEANQTVTWASSNTSVAAVSANGTVTAGQIEGTAIITASTVNNLNAQATVNVSLNCVPATGVIISPVNPSVNVGDCINLTYTLTPADACPQLVTWYSDNTNVATIDANGQVCAQAPGTANITVTLTDGGFTATTAITVNDAPLVRTIEAETFTLTGGTFDDSSVGGPGLGVNATSIGINYVNSGDWAEYTLPNISAGEYRIEYQISTPSDNAQIQIEIDGTTVSTDNVTNNNGWDDYTLLTASNTATLSAGSHTVIIRATGTNTWQWNLDKITLTKIIVDDPISIEVTPQVLTLMVGSTDDLDATVLPTTSNQSVSWSSGDETIATVDATGLVTALAEGTATITASTVNGLTDYSEVTIILPQDLTVEAEAFVETGGTFDDSPYGGPGFGAKKNANSINYVNSGDWMEYTVDVPTSGTYSIEYLTGTEVSGAAVKFIYGSTNFVDAIPNNGNWDNFVSVVSSNTVSLNAGLQTIRLEGAGTQGWEWNMDKFILSIPNAQTKEANSSLSDANEISIYPVPANNLLNISGVQEGAYISIINSTGTEVMQQHIQATGLYQLDISHISSGIYIIRIIENNERQSRIISVQR